MKARRDALQAAIEHRFNSMHGAQYITPRESLLLRLTLDAVLENAPMFRPEEFTMNDKLLEEIGDLAVAHAERLELDTAGGATSVLLGVVLCVLSEDQQNKVLAILKAQGNAQE